MKNKVVLKVKRVEVPQTMMRPAVYYLWTIAWKYSNVWAIDRTYV